MASPAIGGPRRRVDWAERFLEAFAATGNVRLATSAAGVSRDAPYKRARVRQSFADRWAKAREEAIDLLEAEARRRALSGSDALLMFLLRAHRPERYRETVRIDLAREASAIAGLLGVEPEAAIAEAERILAETER
jgi:hypothetical protein